MSDALEDFGDNLSEQAAPLPPATSKSQAKRAAAQKPEVERRVKIVLEDNDQIPPGGQFVQVNGRAFLIQPGVEVSVPLCVLDVLDHAVMSIPVKDASDTVVGYKDRLRFPYRVISSTRHAD